ncbi:MAG TPA: FG-GAP-like repeat-containing protein, partial [Candidatus Eisenbacteria bacterium]|nr:FG-GAP-like repeat-containing protein [Candidatus Eisenbacteria bacterium]
MKEGSSGTTALVFTVTLSGPPGGLATVAYQTVDGTAKGVVDLDFVPTAGTLQFLPNQTTGTIAVDVRGDTKLEGNEWFLVRLSNPVGIIVADSEAVGRITNDEKATWALSYLGQTSWRYGTLSTAMGDLNGDGYLDYPLYFGGPTPPYPEMPGFRAILAEGNYHGASTCDYDKDGDLDMVILGYRLGERGTPDLMLRNRGDGTFDSVAPQLGMAVTGNGETAVWGDFDGDGWPDLFAPYYTDLYPWQGFFYHNNGDGTFTDRAEAVGISTPGVPWALRPEGAHAADWNDDGYLDLYCAAQLFINDGTGHFTDIRPSVGLPLKFDEGMSFVDYDNDGDLDVYLRCLDSPHLYRLDDGQYTEVTAAAGVGTVPLFWGDSWADADNDGDMDLVQHGGGRARLMLNQGDGTFERDMGFDAASNDQELSAWGDADNDGDLDVVIGTIDKAIVINKLHLKQGFHTSGLRVRVLDEGGHMTCYGATVRLKQVGGVPGTTQTRIVDGGSGYLSQNEYTVTFGGVGSGRYELEVVYPSPQGSRIVVDGRSDSRLWSLEPGIASDMKITVYRDGRIDITDTEVTGVPAPNGPSLSRLGAFAPSPARI